MQYHHHLLVGLHGQRLGQSLTIPVCMMVARINTLQGLRVSQLSPLRQWSAVSVTNRNIVAVPALHHIQQRLLLHQEYILASTAAYGW